MANWVGFSDEELRRLKQDSDPNPRDARSQVNARPARGRPAGSRGRGPPRDRNQQPPINRPSPTTLPPEARLSQPSLPAEQRPQKSTPQSTAPAQQNRLEVSPSAKPTSHADPPQGNQPTEATQGTEEGSGENSKHKKPDDEDNMGMVLDDKDIIIAKGSLMPVMYATHGGGALALPDDTSHTSLRKWMEQMGSHFPRPVAILLVSAHWEEDQTSVQTAEWPSLFYDYLSDGLPPAAYEFKYPAPGAPELAKDVAQRLRDAGIPCGENSTRGWDHGVFIPLMFMYPTADIPIVELSLVKGLEPKLHIEIGKALAELRQQGVLILGSGSSYHNLPALFGHVESPEKDVVTQFDDYLIKACCGMKGAKREDQLSEWESATGARACHPTAEHLLPLMVAAGAAGEDTGHHVYSEILFGMPHSSFQFGG